jgi:hypothetical protein
MSTIKYDYAGKGEALSNPYSNSLDAVIVCQHRFEEEGKLQHSRRCRNGL